MTRKYGVSSTGLIAPIVREGDDLVKIVKETVLNSIDNIEDGDIIIGKGGICYMKNGEFTVTSQEKTLFRTDIEQLEAYELMSLEGAVCKGPDKENNGEYRTVTVFYKYYRK